MNLERWLNLLHRWLRAVLGIAFGIILVSFTSFGWLWHGVVVDILSVFYLRDCAWCGWLRTVAGIALGIILVSSGQPWYGVAVIILSVFYGFRSSGELGKFIRDSHERGVRFRSWVVPLRRFRFHHEPYRRETGPDSFIGREALCAEFLALLTNSQNSSGSYLVTGYRGVGKTSVVKKVLHDYADGHHHLNLRERSDLFGPLLMRCSNRWLAWRGKWLLWLHRRQAQRIRKRRDQGRTAPRFFWPIGILVSSVSLANLRWVFGFVLLILLVVSPTAPIGLSLIGVLVVVTLTHQFFKHRVAIFYPPN